MLLSDLKILPASDNMPGVATIGYYAIKGDLSNFPALKATQSEMGDYALIESETGFEFDQVGWYKVYGIQGKGKVESENIGEEDCKVFNNKFTFIYPGTTKEAIGWCRQMKDLDVIFLARQTDGSVVLIGHKNVATTFKVNLTSGDSPTSIKGCTVEVSCMHEAPAPVYEGVITEHVDDAWVDPVPNTIAVISSNQEPDYFHFGIMGLVDQNPLTKNYLALHRLGINHLGNDGKMVKTTSPDGINWTLDPNPIVDWTAPDYDVRAYGGGYLSSGRFICFFSIYNYDQSSWKYLYRIHSDDDGETWSQPVLMQTYDAANRMHAHSNLVKLANGDYIIAFYGIVNNTHEVGLYRSVDGGANWAYEAVINTGITYTYAEPTIEEIAHGEVLMILRKMVTGENGTYRQLYSNDYAATFDDHGDTLFDSWVCQSGRERPAYIVRKDYWNKQIMECWWVNTQDQKLKVVYANCADFATAKNNAWNISTKQDIKQLDPYSGSGGAYTRDGYQTVIFEDNKWLGIGQIYVEHEETPGKSDIEYFWTPASNRNAVLAALATPAQPLPGDETAPAFVSAIIPYVDTLEITFDEDLNDDIVPDAIDFVIDLSGGEINVSQVAIIGPVLFLILDREVQYGETGSVAYTPGTNKLQDAAGNLVAGFDEDVVNAVPE
jgi:hypothetical protein